MSEVDNKLLSAIDIVVIVEFVLDSVLSLVEVYGLNVTQDFVIQLLSANRPNQTVPTNHNSRVRVWVRTRPTANFAYNMLNFHQDGRTISIHGCRDPKKGSVNNQQVDWSFKVDGILHNATQDSVFDTTTADVVRAALDGYNGTVMCYGQTGAGKTFTMTGSTETYQNRGMIPRAISQLFAEIYNRTDYCINVRVSYMEIYNETMYDLLSTLHQPTKMAQYSPLQIVEDEQGVYVRGLQSHLATNEEEALNMLFEGETNRAIACHTLNKQSSRSHCILTLYIESRSRVESNAKYTQSKLNFVDLAGSERLKKTQSEGKTKEEAMYINKSLLFLEQVVLALLDKKREHIPYRQSKLTHFLKDSIGGNCSTRLIANIWAESAQLEETTSTLRFATSMMCIPVVPAVNLHYDPAIMVKNLEKELNLLKKELSMHDTLANRSQITYDPLSEQQKYDIRQQVRAFLEDRGKEIEIVNLRQIQGVFEAFREISTQMAKEIEDRFRSRYTLIDKTDPAAIAGAQQAGIPINDDGELVGVGETDSRGFSVGSTTSTIKPATSSSVVKAKAKKSRQGKERVVTPPTDASPAQVSKTPVAEATQVITTPSADREDKHEESGAVSTASRTKDLTPLRPSTPPPRTEAFEEFKRDAGSEIHRILNENKDVLASKKRAYADLARVINCTKEELDKSLARLKFMQEQRELEGNVVNEDGEIVISENEYLEMNRVKDLKAVYRSSYDELRGIKSEVHYCQKMVDQVRQKLIQEFDSWYEESFLGMAATAEGNVIQQGDSQQSNSSGVLMATHSRPDVIPWAQSSVAVMPRADVCMQAEDEQERFERLQMALLMANPEAAPFHSAQLRTQHRKIYDTASMQPAYGIRRKPGTPTRAVRNQPPNMLQCL